ncbi:hypothetical protein GCM10027294_19620 [Marinactinospora endophytica]
MDTIPDFRKSSHSRRNDCVEIADLFGAAAVRDSQNPDGHLIFPAGEMAAFLDAIRADEL